MSKRLIATGVLAVALAVAGSALAITGGQRDGNGHPNVGAMMAYWDPTTPNTLQELCSGTLVAPQVFLTAAHCTDYLLNTLGITDVWVTFNTNSTVGPYIHGRMVQDPAFHNDKPNSDPNDIAVILLDSAPQGITPANLPQVGLFDQMKAGKTLTQSTAFTAVGYGDGDREHTQGGGTPGFAFDGFRWVSTSFFNSLQSNWLRLTQNQSVGAGGTCFGDSGGPNFLGTSQTIAATTITGDSVCAATNVDLRMDTQSAQDFLAQFGVPRG
ncbi:MAG TPA: trypsin-like serine protease [Gaiellaceae bacterium]